ncbi:MAG TPA: Uma2 family endonuclease [Thermomicrobiales bacterium]|nr:Uma2 family endonuclease [Thermomicrobiales bacterium]
MATKTRLTAADLFALPDDGFRYELVDGELVRMPPPGFRHSRITTRVARFLDTYVDAHDLGAVVDNGGFKLQGEPDVVLAPDVAFVQADRIPPAPETIGYPEIPPDLAVDVMSPSDEPADIEAKIRRYLRAGVRAVWLLDPARKTISVRTPDGPTYELGMDDTLDGGNMVPGFSVQVADLFR